VMVINYNNLLLLLLLLHACMMHACMQHVASQTQCHTATS
jgi:hypothetical protein